MSFGKSISELYSGRDPFDALLDRMNKQELVLKKFEKLNYLLAYIEDEKFRPKVNIIEELYNKTGKISRDDKIYLNGAYRYGKRIFNYFRGKQKRK